MEGYAVSFALPAPMGRAPIRGAGVEGGGGGEGADLERVKGLAKKSDPSLDKVYHLYFELA